MKAGWSLKPLGEVCDRKPSKGEARRRLADTDKVSFVPMYELGIHQKYFEPAETRPLSAVVGSYTYFADGDVLLAKITPCFENGKLGIAQGLENGIGFGSSEFMVLRPKPELLSEYLYYFLDQELFRELGAKAMTGAVGHKRIPPEFVEALKIPLPPLDEQRRIVAVLDKAFAGIATATENTEKNLTNARAIFDSYLHSAFTERGNDWVEEPITKNVRFIDYRGKTPPKRDKGVRLITAKNVKMGYVRRTPEEFIDPAAYNDWMTRGFPKKGDVLFTTEAPLGNVAQLDTDEKVVIGQRLITMQPVPQKIDSTFLKYMLCSAPLQEAIRSHATGATVLGIKAKLLKTIPIFYPKSIDAQLEIVENLDRIYDQVELLSEHQKTKLNALTELRQSILQNAFAGEFMAEIATQNTSVANHDFSTPQGTARILAFAYRRHQMQSQQQTYGRVKAQKSLHLVESIGGIDLGRQPMKDAAGPNDFPHMLRAEEWAEAQGFFKFVLRASGNGYDFKKLANYDTLWADAIAATKPVATALEKAIDPIVPMVSLDAEVFATVHAAWNNLIRDGAAVTDDTIVKAARDDWHSAKLKIPEHKFRDAIRTIKAKDMEPDGSAKYVGGQVQLI